MTVAADGAIGGTIGTFAGYFEVKNANGSVYRCPLYNA